MTKRKSSRGAQISAKTRKSRLARVVVHIPRAPRGRPFGPDNPGAPFPRGTSGNPGGRPKVLSERYRDMLNAICPDDKEGRTYGELIAQGMAVSAMRGVAPAAREIRQATEGTKILTGHDATVAEVADALRNGSMTEAELIAIVGEEASREFILAARNRPAPETGAGTSEATPQVPVPDATAE